MILKIRKNQMGKNVGWFVFSGIADVNYSNKLEGEIAMEALVKGGGRGMSDLLDGEAASYTPRRFHPDASDKTGACIKIFVRFVGGGKEEWLVQAETYLLNDEGKTIERIF